MRRERRAVSFTMKSKQNSSKFLNSFASYSIGNFNKFDEDSQEVVTIVVENFCWNFQNFSNASNRDEIGLWDDFSREIDQKPTHSCHEQLQLDLKNCHKF